MDRFRHAASWPRPWFRLVLLAGAAAAVVALVALVLARGDDDVETTDEPTPTVTAGPEATPTPAAPTATPGEPEATTTPVPPPAEDSTCTGPRWVVTFPGDWYTSDDLRPCELFSPAPIDLAPASDYSLEIDLAITPEPYEVALRRIPGAPEYAEITGTTTTTVSGQRATVFDAVTSGVALAEAGYRQHLYVVDLGDATFFAAASEWLSQSNAPPDYERNVAVLDQMMETIALGAGGSPPCVPDDLPEEADVALGEPIYLDLDPAGDPSSTELIVATGTNAAGTNWTLYTEVGCVWEPVADLVQHAAVATSSDWGCQQLEDGVLVLTSEARYVDEATGYDITVTAYELEGTELQPRETYTGTNPDPSLPSAPPVGGPDSCR